MKVRFARLLILLSGIAFINFPACSMDDSESAKKLTVIQSAKFKTLAPGVKISVDHITSTYKTLRGSGNNASDKELVKYLLGKTWKKLTPTEKTEIVTHVVSEAQQNPLEELMRQSGVLEAYRAVRASGNGASDPVLIQYLYGTDWSLLSQEDQNLFVDLVVTKSRMMDEKAGEDMREAEKLPPDNPVVISEQANFSVDAVSGASTVPAIALPPLSPINMRSEEQKHINWEHARVFEVKPQPDPFMDKFIVGFRTGELKNLAESGPIRFGLLDSSNKIIEEEGASQLITEQGKHIVFLEASLKEDPNPKLQAFISPMVYIEPYVVGFFQFPITAKTPYSPAIEIYLKNVEEDNGGAYHGGFLPFDTHYHYQNLKKIEIRSLIENAMRENSPGVFGWKAAGLAYGKYGYTQDHPTLLAFIDEYVDRKDEGAIQWKANALFHNLFNIKGNSESFYAFLKDQAAKGSRVALGLQNETQKGIYYKGRAGYQIYYWSKQPNLIGVKFPPKPDDQGIHDTVSNLLKLDNSIKEEEKSSAMEVNCVFVAGDLPVISSELIEKEVQEGNRMALYLKAKFMLTHERKTAFIRFYQLIFPCINSHEHRIGWFYDENMAP